MRHYYGVVLEMPEANAHQSLDSFNSSAYLTSHSFASFLNMPPLTESRLASTDGLVQNAIKSSCGLQAVSRVDVRIRQHE